MLSTVYINMKLAYMKIYCLDIASIALYNIDKIILHESFSEESENFCNHKRTGLCLHLTPNSDGTLLSLWWFIIFHDNVMYNYGQSDEAKLPIPASLNVCKRWTITDNILIPQK